MEGCIFQFFNLLSKSSLVDIEKFSNCAVGVSGEVEGRGRASGRLEGEVEREGIIIMSM